MSSNLTASANTASGGATKALQSAAAWAPSPRSAQRAAAAAPDRHLPQESSNLTADLRRSGDDVSAAVLENQRLLEMRRHLQGVLGGHDAVRAADEMKRRQIVAVAHLIQRRQLRILGDEGAGHEDKVECQRPERGRPAVRRTQPDQQRGQCATLAETEHAVESAFFPEQINQPIARTGPPLVSLAACMHARVAAPRRLLVHDRVPPAEISARQRWGVDADEFRQIMQTVGQHAHLVAQNFGAAVIAMQAQDAQLRHNRLPVLKKSRHAAGFRIAAKTSKDKASARGLTARPARKYR